MALMKYETLAQLSSKRRRGFHWHRVSSVHVMNIYNTPWKLASFGELDGLKKLFEDGVKCDEPDERGFTPLAWAARNAHIPVLQFLIEHNCSKETTSFGGMKPLHHACNKNNERAIRVLLKAGADVNSLDENGDSALHYSSARGVLNIVVALLDAGATNKSQIARESLPFTKQLCSGSLPWCDDWWRQARDKNAKDAAGDTPLHYASRCGYAAVVKFLLESEANTQMKNGAGLVAKEVAQTGAIAALFDAPIAPAA